MSATRTLFTREDFEQLPEGFPCELIEGEFVKEPAPLYQHQRVVGGLLHTAISVLGNARVVLSPIDVVLDETTVLQPDVAVFATPLPAGLRRVPLPVLVVEVLSDGTADRDRGQKTRLYLAAGVREVWLIDPDTGTIEVRTSGNARTYASDDLVSSDAVPELSVRGRDLIS